MIQFDVHQNPNPATRNSIPYLLMVQSGLLDTLTTRVVAPLALASERPKPAKILNPRFEIEGTSVVMLTEQLSGVSVQAIGKRVTSLAAARDEIMAALDFLFCGI